MSTKFRNTLPQPLVCMLAIGLGLLPWVWLVLIDWLRPVDEVTIIVLVDVLVFLLLLATAIGLRVAIDRTIIPGWRITIAIVCWCFPLWFVTTLMLWMYASE